MKKFIVTLMLLFSSHSMSETVVTFDYLTSKSGSKNQVEAVVRLPENNKNNGALIILHHAGGYSFGTTRQYSEFFSKNGFLTLELKMFETHNQRPSSRVLHGQLMGALNYLATRQDVDPKKISVMGMSLGAYLGMVSATTWFYEEYGGRDHKFNKIVALYPICWFMREALKGQTQGINLFNDLPSNFLGGWQGIPTLMLVAGKDDYDGGKGGECPKYLDEIQDLSQKSRTKIEIYQDATHGWDHGKTYSFPVRGACVGRSNCMNRNVSSPEIVEKGKMDALRFLTE
jgi:dienelactone hydrolase